MYRKQIWIEFGKIILAGVIALAILTTFCMFYYNVPIRYTCEDGATDCKRKPNVFYSRGTEGFAYGKTNNEGYTNMFDYEDGDLIDILVMGSSNMEAYQVAMEESTASRLNAMLENDTVYNIGMDSHNFITCADNFQAAVSKYQPSKYVIIETVDVEFSAEDLVNAINGTVVEIPSYSGGVVGFLQKNQYLRLINAQIGKFMDGKKIIDLGKLMQADKSEVFIKTNEKGYSQKSAKINAADGNIDLLNRLLQKINSEVKACGAKIIIVYHPHTQLDGDGKLLLMNHNPEAIEHFSELCECNGILFLDMSSRFLEEYANNYILPEGFINTYIGVGHMNKYGHAMMADELYKLIERN